MSLSFPLFVSVSLSNEKYFRGKKYCELNFVYHLSMVSGPGMTRSLASLCFI